MKKYYFGLFILLLIFNSCKYELKTDKYIHYEQKNCVDVSLKKIDYKDYYLICIKYKNNTNNNIFIPSGKYSYGFLKPYNIHKDSDIISFICSCSVNFINNEYNTYIKEKDCECKNMIPKEYLNKKQRDSLFYVIKNTINDTLLKVEGKEINRQIYNNIKNLIFLKPNQIYLEVCALKKEYLKKFYNYNFYLCYSYPNNFPLYNIRIFGYESYTFKYPPVINGYHLYDTPKCLDTIYFKKDY